MSENSFRDILATLPEKRPRSRLAPYRRLIAGLRRRGRTYREIVEILAEKCNLRVSVSTLLDKQRSQFLEITKGSCVAKLPTSIRRINRLIVHEVLANDR
jgi:hypothetical protein